MRVGALLGLSLTVGVFLAAGCAAGRDPGKTTGEAGSAGQGAQGGGGSAGSGNNGGGGTNVGGGPVGGGGQGGTGPACVKFTAAAEQAPAAMLIALDMSASMTTNNKWGTSQ